ncbi:hypothetical protein THAOC_36972 [Thalassiosira oceanica]|uniref:Uncharacterized protein n=1 Tax=Thalassiosira oceanica TaxID=159749 RepID=K0QYV3_THAOC|nr:hypothetical protein THAOC_36972 [Thalassiosira oceanica]|eukprot:EJK44483.1 hypothetical protein THAOC_36972 [Thalassiosira oceanica]
MPVAGEDWRWFGELLATCTSPLIASWPSTGRVAFTLAFDSSPAQRSPTFVTTYFPSAKRKLERIRGGARRCAITLLSAWPFLSRKKPESGLNAFVGSRASRILAPLAVLRPENPEAEARESANELNLM